MSPEFESSNRDRPPDWRVLAAAVGIAALTTGLGAFAIGEGVDPREIAVLPGVIWAGAAILSRRGRRSLDGGRPVRLLARIDVTVARSGRRVSSGPVSDGHRAERASAQRQILDSLLEALSTVRNLDVLPPSEDLEQRSEWRARNRDAFASIRNLWRRIEDPVLRHRTRYVHIASARAFEHILVDIVEHKGCCTEEQLRWALIDDAHDVIGSAIRGEPIPPEPEPRMPVSWIEEAFLELGGKYDWT